MIPALPRISLKNQITDRDVWLKEKIPDFSGIQTADKVLAICGDF